MALLLGRQRSKKASPIDQINKDNVAPAENRMAPPRAEPRVCSGNLQVRPVTTSRDADHGERGALRLECGCSPRRSIRKTDRRCGQKIPAKGVRGSTANRGLAYWSEEPNLRLLTYTNSFLYALDPKTGRRFRTSALAAGSISLRGWDRWRARIAGIRPRSSFATSS